MRGRPLEHGAGARDVERVVVVGPVDHPRLDEGILAWHHPLNPGANLGDRPRDIVRFPGIAVQQPRKRVLQFVVAEGLRFTDQDRNLSWHLSATFYGVLDGVDRIVQMNERLAVRGFARIEVASELPFVDALDLVRQRRRVTEIVVNAGKSQDHGGDVAALRTDEGFSADLRFRIGPGRTDWPVLGQEFARIARPVHEHGAGENELLDLEPFAQTVQQAPGALDRDLFVFRARLAEKIVIGRQMNHGCNPGTVTFTQDAQSFLNTLIGSDVDGDARTTRRRRTRRLAVETHDIAEASRQPLHHSTADVPVGTSDQDDLFFLFHVWLS